MKIGFVEGGRGKKDVDGKLRLDLLPPEAMLEIGKVYTDGCKRYGDRNWEQGIPTGEVIAALERHVLRYKLGQTVCKDGSLEMGHVAFWAMALISQYYRDVSDGNVFAARGLDEELIKDFLES